MIIVEVDWTKTGFGVAPGAVVAGADVYTGIYSDVEPSGTSDTTDTTFYADDYSDVEMAGTAIGMYTDTDRVRPYAQAIHAEYGRDQSTALSPTVAGSGGFTLDNYDRRYSPRNTASPLYGYLKPARPVRISRTIGDGSAPAVYEVPEDPSDGYPDVYSDAYESISDGSGGGYEGGYEGGYGAAVDANAFVLFNGHTDDSPINPDVESKTVSLTLVDSLADMRGLNVNTGLHRDLRTGTAIGYILDACNWPADLRDLDVGATIIPWWWEDNTDALTALERIVRSEGPPALLTVGADGGIIFRDRHHRLTRTPSLTSQSTWYPTGTVEPVMTRGFSYDEAWRNIINTGNAAVESRTLGEIVPVWTSDATITLSGGQQTIITAASSEPFLNAITPVAGTDYTLMSGSVTVRLIRDSGMSTGIELTAGGTPVVLTGLQLRANPLTVAYTTQATAGDPSSISEYGARSFPGDLPWCGEGDAQAVLDIAVAMRAQPLPIVTARFMVGQNTARAAAVLSRDLSDRVTIIEPETALVDDFYIESIGHEITRHETDHTVSFGLEAASPDPVLTPINEFRFDVTGSGFNQGVFGGGLTSSLTMFRFDRVLQGFDLGAFAA